MNKMKTTYNIIIVISAFIFLCACEKDVDIEMPGYTPSVVIEGFIANEENPVIVLTNNIEFSSESGYESYENSFIHNALITVKPDNGSPDTLFEISQTDEKTGLTTSYYTTQDITGYTGVTYELTVIINGNSFSGKATIPESVSIKDIWYEDHPVAENDSFKTVWVSILDPIGTNYYRYTSEVNGERGPQPEISTLTDKAFEGKEFTKAVDSGLENEEEDIHGGVSGYFSLGDTITVYWINAEKSYYNIWTTIDFKRSQNQNPFLNPTRIVGNIDGCLGYWSGLGVDTKTIILE